MNESSSSRSNAQRSSQEETVDERQPPPARSDVTSSADQQRTPVSATFSLSVIIPAYNEEDGIADVLSKLAEVLEPSVQRFEIIVVDDGSNDRTAERVGGEHVRLLRQKRNQGYGATIRRGLRHARFDWV